MKYLCAPPRIVAAIAALAFFTAIAPMGARADWYLPLSSPDVRTLPDAWESYFGIHYLKAEDFEPQWSTQPVFETVRDYGQIGAPVIVAADGSRQYDVTQMARYVSGNPLTGPFTGDPVYLSPGDISNRIGTFNLMQAIPQILDNDLTAIYTVEGFFPSSSTEPVDKDYIYWTLRQVYEAYPEAVDHVLWQWGNEINADGDVFSPGQANDPAGIPIYVDKYLGPAIEAIQLVEHDLVANGTLPADTHIPVLSGSFITISNTANRQWMTSVLNATFTGENVSSDAIVGKQVSELVDIATVHYPFGAHENAGAQVMGNLVDEWVDTGEMDGIWITEEHGQRGEGPADLTYRAMRFLDWAVNDQIDSATSRNIWWSTTASDDPGGQGIEAVDLLGSIFSGKVLREAKLSLDGADAFAVLAQHGPAIDSVTLVIVPEDFPTDGTPAVTPGVIELQLPAGVLSGLGDASVYQFSLEVPTQSWTLPVAWDASRSVLSLNLLDSSLASAYSFHETLLVTIPLALTTVPEPASALLLAAGIVALPLRLRRRHRFRHARPQSTGPRDAEPLQQLAGQSSGRAD